MQDLWGLRTSNGAQSFRPITDDASFNFVGKQYNPVDFVTVHQIQILMPDVDMGTAKQRDIASYFKRMRVSGYRFVPQSQADKKLLIRCQPVSLAMLKAKMFGSDASFQNWQTSNM